MIADAPSSPQFELIYPRPGENVLVDQDPRARSGHAMVADEGHLYVVGGYTPSGQAPGQGRPEVLGEMWKFSIATRRWTKLQSSGFPLTCASSCLLLRGRRLYLFGGTSFPFGQDMSNTFKVCDLVQPRTQHSSVNGSFPSYNWCSLENEASQAVLHPDDQQIHPKGYGQSIVFQDKYVYTFGGAVGFHNEAINALHRLNLENLTWERLTPSGDEQPCGRYKHEIIRDSDCFYVVGGGRLHTAQPVDVLYCYTFSRNTWSRHPTLADPVHGSPKARCAFSLVQVHRDVYICGGQFYGINHGPHEILNDVWHFRLDTFRWTKLAVILPERLYFHRAVMSPCAHMYVYGGVDENGRRCHKVYRYRLPFHVPHLKEICWSLIARLWKDLHRADLRQLREIHGIPQPFIDRL